MDPERAYLNSVPWMSCSLPSSPSSAIISGYLSMFGGKIKPKFYLILTKQKYFLGGVHFIFWFKRL